MRAYKLFRKMADGQLAPLFINAKQRIKFGEWLPAENHPTKGFAARAGWHCGLLPKADHLSSNRRVWAEIEVGNDYYEFKRPKNQGGMWIIAESIKVIRELTTSQVSLILSTRQLELDLV